MASVAAQPPPSHHPHLHVVADIQRMPHALPSPDIQAENDDDLISKLLNEESTEGLDLFNGPLVPGEKANDAIDYEDIDDDDLADEEDGASVVATNGENATLKPGAVAADDEGLDTVFADQGTEAATEDDGFDDLFGDLPSHTNDNDGSNFPEHPAQSDGVGISLDQPAANDLTAPSNEAANQAGSRIQKFATSYGAPLPREKELSAKDLARFHEQQALLALSSSHIPPPPPESSQELLASLYPKFVQDETPYFMNLLPKRKAHYIGKQPLKPPKPIQPTKISLELSNDQEKAFRIAGPVASKKTDELEAEQKGLIVIPCEESSGNESDAELEPELIDEGEDIGGVSWNDLKILCADWDSPSAAGSSDDMPSPANSRKRIESDQRDDDDASDSEQLPPSTKRQKTTHLGSNFFALPPIVFPSLEDPELATSKIARSVTLDLNDPQLLVDIRQPDIQPNKKRRLNGHSARGTTFSTNISQRYNISNDAAYDLLKENHQSKIRSTIGTLTIEHSMPALRLQYPYYKIKLHKSEARDFHRPAMKFTPNLPILFNKPQVTKRKHLKGKDIQSIFESTKDLSLGDNSNALLLEYSEEHPTMLSNFGMGSRVLNYYRRKNIEDTSRPKQDIGETTVLLPQDKSPFSIFGNVNPGETVPTLHNGMYRAPLFQHQAKMTDFLVIRNRTGVEGVSWYIRNVENLYVVGQELPLVEVPGPHSRRVTTASKNRLKMISFRKLKKNRPHRINVSEVTEHFPDTTDMQNRQKMKEFMQFSKEHKEWEMRPGEAIPDEATLRALIKPEDVCLLESMQVGQRHLQDAGYSKEDEDAEEGEDSKEGQSIEQQLAPWHTTKNFIHATQGKAMLQLHGEGDPSGRGEAFSFVKTSMKGGFKVAGESIDAKLEAKKSKETGGHSYNVARQQKAYDDSIRRIWDGQTNSLSAVDEISDTELDDEHTTEPEDLFGEAKTPRSGAPTPAPIGRRDDETTSQFSRFSTSSQSGKVLRIKRQIEDGYGSLQAVEEIIRDPRIIRQYLKRRHAIEAENLRLSDLKPTGDAERDKRAKMSLQKELARLERNKDRRIARDKQKGVLADGADMSPGSPNSPAAGHLKPAGTARKCANCGRVGHIKTNKKLCPMLNGTLKQDESFGDAAFGSLGGAPTL